MYHYQEVDLNINSNTHSSIAIDQQTLAQAELDAYIEAQSQEIAPEIEVDSIPDHDFGESSAVLGFPQVEQLAIA